MRWYQRFFRRDLTEKHLDAELQFHPEQQIARCASAGMKLDEAAAGRGMKRKFQV